MAEKKLPTGVGKKIVEALKKQEDLDIAINNDVVNEEETITISSNNNEVIDTAVFSDIDKKISSYEELITDDVNDIDLNQIEDVSNNMETPAYEMPQVAFEQEPQISVQQTMQNNFNTYQDSNFNTNVMNNYREVNNMSVENDANNFNVPANVAVLKKLISQLPNGVSKQTGAQIIRQTMEALGISMNSVLAEAQQMQDGLNDSIKNCMSTVNEYKQNIMTLEKQVIDYQKQAKSVNDLISLFILTDK